MLEDRPDLTLTQLTRTRQLMDAHVLDALVEGYEHRIDALALPDPDRRAKHTLASRANYARLLVELSRSMAEADRDWLEDRIFSSRLAGTSA